MTYINQPNSKILDVNSLNPHFWYNMDDYNFEVDESNGVKMCYDLTGKLNHFTQTVNATFRPQLSTGLNGRNCMLFDGVDDRIGNNSESDLDKNDALDIYFVYSDTSGAVGLFDLNGNNIRAFTSASNGQRFRLRRDDNTYFTYSPLNVGNLVRYRFTGKVDDGISDMMSVRTNKSNEVSYTIGNGGFFRLNGQFRFGLNNTVGWFNGKLYEVIIFKRNISDTEDLKLKNYLNNKYNIW